MFAGTLAHISRESGEMNVNYPVSSVASEMGCEQNISADDKRSEIKGQGATCCKFDGNFALWPRLRDRS